MKPLFNEFPPPTMSEWWKLVREETGDERTFTNLTWSTYDGIAIPPICLAVDTENAGHLNYLPGFPPYSRGITASGNLAIPILIAQGLSKSDPVLANTELVKNLDSGQNVIVLDLCHPMDENPSEIPAIHKEKTCILLKSYDEFSSIFSGIPLDKYPIHLKMEDPFFFLPLLQRLIVEKNVDTGNIRGQIRNDPFENHIIQGFIPESLPDLFRTTQALLDYSSENLPGFRTILINAGIFHESGSGTVEELVCSLCMAIETMNALLDLGFDAERIASSISFSFSIGTDFVVEICKLRVARMLWAKIVRQYTSDESCMAMDLHIASTHRNKAMYDPHTNILRTTLECVAGMIGGGQSISLSPFDDVDAEPSELAMRVARNTQLVLNHEAYLSAVIDPAGGSFYFEYLTDELAQETWHLLQEVESRGGFVAAFNSGFLPGLIHETTELRRTNIAKRKEAYVGVSSYPNPREPKRAIRLRDEEENQLVNKDNAIKPFRGPEEFELIRSRIANLPHIPKAFLMKFGKEAHRNARASFSRDFLSPLGCEFVENTGMESIETLMEICNRENTDIVIFCSENENYPKMVPEFISLLRPQNPKLIFVVAGQVQSYTEALRSAGVDEFIYLDVEADKILRRLTDRLEATQSGGAA